MLADVFENFWNIGLERYDHDLACFPPALWLAMQAALKKTKVKLDFLTNTDKLMVEKGIRGRICHTIYGYVKANNKYMENYDKNKESSCLKFWDVNNLYRWAMS